MYQISQTVFIVFCLHLSLLLVNPFFFFDVRAIPAVWPDLKLAALKLSLCSFLLGPDLVICDEGHILKNEASAVSKAMNSIRTRRRIVLTGTPLQNNLIECETSCYHPCESFIWMIFVYFLKITFLTFVSLPDHCMVNFIKENLLGSVKEFRNRFINPIQNGQCADSTLQDVRVMKKRAHILYEMLAGCVQVYI